MAVHIRGRSHATGLPATFTPVFAGASLSYLGLVLSQFTLPLFAAALSRDPALVGAVAIAQAAPWLVLGLVAGTMVDRHDRRLVQLTMNGLRLAAMLVLVLSALTGALSPALLIAVAALRGVSDAFIESAQAALMPAVVGPDRLDRANARIFAARTAAEIVATPVAGALATRSLALAAGAAALVTLIALVAWFRVPGGYRAVSAGRGTIVRETVEGIRFLWRHRLLRTVTLMAAVINACWSAWGALLVLYAIAPGPLGLDPFSFGVLATASGVGGLLGALVAGRVQRWLGRRAAFGINIAVNALLFGVTALTANPWLVAPALLAGDTGGPLWGIATLSLQASATPDALRGRVASAYRFLSYGAMAAGPVLGALIASRFGIQFVFGLCAIATAAMVVPWLRVVTEAALANPGPR